MKIYFLLFAFLPLFSFSQDGNYDTFKKDTLINIESNPSKNFHHPYIIFIPKGTPKSKMIYLLVEPNNTGITSDSLEVHKKAASDLASVSSVGNNISNYLKIPLLVPVFPRPDSIPLVYTHALDRDVMLRDDLVLKRLDLQLIAMIEDAKLLLKDNGILTHDKFFMNGFSASGSFTNRFLFIHPERVKAAAMGGLNGKLMLPLEKFMDYDFNFPLGTNDFEELFNKKCDLATYKVIPQFIYMGSEDQNDAVQFDDAYNDDERKTIHSTLGKQVQERWINCQQVYNDENITAQFKTYNDVGHWTTSAMNLEVIKFFMKTSGN